ncbi:MAG: Nitrogen regulatory protein, partial [Planctomycetota bacterium]
GRPSASLLPRREDAILARDTAAAVPARPRHEARPMKEVIAIVKPFLAERVLEALKFAPLEACTVREVKGYGRQKSYLDQYGDSDYALAFLPKVEIQLWVDDARVDEVVERITEVARTGRMGDGKIFVLPAVAMPVP